MAESAITIVTIRWQSSAISIPQRPGRVQYHRLTLMFATFTLKSQVAGKLKHVALHLPQHSLHG